MTVNHSHSTANYTAFNAVAPQFDIENWLEQWQPLCLFYCVSADGVLTYVSDSVRTILGYAASELVGQPAQNFFDIEHPAAAELDSLSARLSLGSEDGARYCLARKSNGEIAYLDIRQRRVTDAQGNSVLFEVLASDATSRIEAEFSLHHSEQRYRRLVEGLKGDYIIYSHDPDGIITYISPSVRNVLGYDPEDVLGKNWREFVGENFRGREAAERVDSDIAAGKVFHKFKMEVAHADGGRRVTELQEHPIFGPDGKYISMEGIGKDITDSVRTAEELQELKDRLEQLVTQRTLELQESENRYRNVVEDQTEFIVRWLPTGTCTFVNKAYCRYFGRDRDEVIGSVYAPRIVEADRPMVEREIAALTPGKPSATTENRVYRSDGSVGWNLWTNRALFNKEGRLVEYQSVGRDISKLKKAAHLIREKEAHLAHVSRLATLGELVAGIAHEIHQPLHAATTFAEAARRSLEGDLPDSVPTAIECTNEISQAVRRAAKIIRHLRKFAKPHPTELKQLKINQVVTESLRIMTHETLREQVTQQIHLAEGLPRVEGDAIQLEQLCINLVKNAYEAMTDTPVADRTIVITTYEEPDGVVVSVRDSGCGIERAENDRLFDAFYTTKSSGMGMGLSVCKSIAEAHGAKILFEQNGDHGTTFKLLIPKLTERV